MNHKLKAILIAASALAAAGCGSRYSSVNPLLTMAEGDCASAAVARMRAGTNTDYVDHCGNVWTAEQTYSPGSWGRVESPNFGGGTGPLATIPYTKDPGLYWFSSIGPAITYKFTLAPGSYKVRLHFLEDYWDPAGSRVMTVAVQGVVLTTSLDLAALVGKKAAYVLSTTATVSGTELTISITKSPGSIDSNATINAVEVKL